MGKNNTKKAHEQFLKDLWEKNKYYRQNFFKVVGKYKNCKTRLTVLTKYGECSALPNNLLKDVLPNINSAINKTEYWKNQCLDRFGEEGNDDLSQVEYINSKTKVKIIDPDFGEYLITPNGYYNGNRSIKKGNKSVSDFKRSDQKEVFDKIRELHPDLEILQGQIFKRKDKKILVRDKYGVCKITPNNLLKKNSTSIRSAIDKQSYWINQVKEVHGDKYDYSLVEYKDSRKKVKIIGPNGVFEKCPAEHKIGQGCPIEAYKNVSKRNKENPVGWRYETWIRSGLKSKHFDSFKVYFIECWDEETGERFYKIGKTYKTVKRRFRTKTRLPYKYNIIYTLELEDGRKICELEQGYQNKNKEYNYTPKKKFDGMYECFSKLIEI